MALGMSGVTPTNTPTVEHDPKKRESVLSYLARTPQGQTVKKLTGFAADEQTGTNPQVKWYAGVVNPRRTNAPIATADVRKVKSGWKSPTRERESPNSLPSRPTSNSFSAGPTIRS